MTPRKAVRLPAAILVSLLTLPGPGARAQEWRAVGEGTGVSAGFAQKGRLAGLVFRCEGAGAVRLLLSGDGSRFADERPHTLVISVDGLGEATTVRAEPEGGGSGASRFVRSATLAEVLPLLDRLAKGREVEVSGPAGSYRLPLRGSGAAINRFKAGCR